MSYLDQFYKEYTKQQAIETCKDIVKPNFFKLSLPNASAIQEKMPDFLQTKWSKLLADVDKSSSTLKFVLRAMLLGDSQGVPEAGSLTLSSVTPANVTMIFGAFKNRQEHRKFTTLTQDTLGHDFVVLKLNGEGEDKTTNNKAELKVKKAVAAAQEEGKRVVIISKDMASRSFSIPEIDTVFLMYDGGLLSQTIQKVSRAFSTGKTYSRELKTHGTVITLSLDANREELDPIDLYVVNEAARIEEEGESLQDSIRRVCLSTNIFVNDIAYGSFQLESDKYANDLIKNTSTLKLIAASLSKDKLASIDFSDAILAERTSSTTQRNQDNISVDTSKVRTTLPNGAEDSNANENEVSKNEQVQFIKNVIFFINNITQLQKLNNYEASNLVEILTSLRLKNLQAMVESFYGLKFDTLELMVKEDKVPTRLLNTVIDAHKTEPLTF